MDRISKAVMPTLFADSKTETRLTNDGVLWIGNEINLGIPPVDSRELRIGAFRRHGVDQPAGFIAIRAKCRRGGAGCIENAKFRRRAAAVQQRLRSFDGVLPPRCAIGGVRVHRRRSVQHDDDPLVLSSERFDFRPRQRHGDQQRDGRRDDNRNNPSQLFPQRVHLPLVENAAPEDRGRNQNPAVAKFQQIQADDDRRGDQGQ